MSEQAEPQVELVEDRIPLEGIRETIEAVIEAHGGETWSASADSIRFTLPVRQGVAVGGAIVGTIRWEPGEDGGIVTVTAGERADPPRLSHIALLVAGTIGAILWILWPFYPALGPASWVGAALAFAAWFLTLRRTRGGVVARLLAHIAEEQRNSSMIDD
ncbi:MAG TPA: hypothetical protein VMS56_08405 [Thermoanaerobaculia bacterium]|nr:hypothetical protein [Thermoanaerobaculia bacterium]